ncbi:MAG TPA: cytochrome b/b6 domain-containing protein [Cyclobacteriaceae bacterium]|nr:cytochrome b/b6 domain-containing protein [Cyclobacteriaceae bacterium]
MSQNQKTYSKEHEWRHWLGYSTAGLILFETITGLSIYLLPFSILNQVQVVLHTGIGLVFIVPVMVYMVRHWLVYRSITMNHYKLTGYALMVTMVILAITGILLTFEAVFGTRISKLWDLVHTAATFCLVAFCIPHIVLIIIRDRKSGKTPVMQAVLIAQNSWVKRVITISVFLFFGAGLWSLLYIPDKWENEFPEDYSYLYGEDRPFAPSLAKTKTGGAFDPRSLGNSEGCGTAGCHEEIYKEWQVSAHRYAAMDVAFQTIQGVMGQQNGSESTRYCGGCHDPISLFSGSKNIYTSADDLTNIHGYQEGISCIACHSIKQTDVKGNANYVIEQPNRYMYELKEGEAAKFFSNFLIRSFPEYHVETFQHKLFKSPEFCAACHKQFIDEEVNNVGWVQLQNQYDKWRKSKWNHPGDPAKTVECRECHMPLMDGKGEPATGDDMDYNRSAQDGKFRSHRFLAANQFIPAALNLPGAEEHVRLTEEWLKGNIDIPEIRDKWTEGPVVPVELIVPEKVMPGEEVKFSVLLTNNKPGHDFPTGPIDIIQSWLEITVTDQDSNIVFRSGHLDQDYFIQPGSFVFKVEPVDQYGNLIDKHNLWEMVGVRFNRSMFPGFTDQAEFMFNCPADTRTAAKQKETSREFKFINPSTTVTNLNITARLKYRKVDQYLINYMFGKDSGITTRITELSSDHKTIRVAGIKSGPELARHK